MPNNVGHVTRQRITQKPELSATGLFGITQVRLMVIYPIFNNLKE
jgi:hypothetical protein